MSDSFFKNKKVIITGGAKGIGRSLVYKLINKEAVVGVFDIDTKPLNKLKSDYKNLSLYRCDISNYSKVSESVNRFYSLFKNIDILVNNAGLIYNSPLISLSTGGIKKHDIKMWKKVIDIDLNSVFYMTACVAEKMILNRTKGIIINVSSISSAGNPGQSAYSAAKAGVNSLTSAWSKELGPLGIRVAGIAPGFTETETMRKSMTKTIIDQWRRKIPLHRLAQPDEISEGIISIINNQFFNGKVFELDGGLVI